ncbi:MAG: polysulfide reductase NrfD [Bacillota bacterium]|nr:polysulfide reductase NrfD [Bacillota bacterium]
MSEKTLDLPRVRPLPDEWTGGLPADRYGITWPSRKAALAWFAPLTLAGFATLGMIAHSLVGGLALTQLSSWTPWGLWIALYIFFLGLSAGAFLLSSLVHVFGQEQFQPVGRDALLAAILSMMIGMLFVWLDLGHPERALNAWIFWNPRSVLAWEIRFYVLYIALLAAELYFSMRTDLIRAAQGSGWRARVAAWLRLGSRDLSEAAERRDRRIRKILGIVGIPLAVFGVHGGTGLLFAAARARPAWNTGIFPVIFVVSAITSGAALALLLYWTRERVSGRPADPELMDSLSKFLVALLTLDWMLQVFEYVVAVYDAGPHELEILTAQFLGPFAWTFWGLQLTVGAILPILLMVRSWRRHDRRLQPLAALLVLAGIVGVRVNIVVPALIPPVMPGLPWSFYAPNLFEWLMAAGVFAVALWLYTGAATLLPLEPAPAAEAAETDGGEQV